MSFDQAIICRGKGGIYAVPWLAGTSGSQTLAKYYKNNDIDCVNVGKTCDALRFALNSKCSTKQNFDSLDTENCIVKEGSIPFRVCTNIWFGTLKIYQQQVNNLYKQSEDLVACSSCYDTPQISLKRKGDSHNTQLKKRRLSIKETIGLSNANYSQLLDDFEKWTQQSPDKQSEEVSLSKAMRPHMSTVRSVAHLHIREITIREISATSYGIPELDDDDGFGEASSDEITKFLSLSDGRVKRMTPVKRKSNYEEEIPHKLSRIRHDMTVENDCCGCSPLPTDFLATPSRLQRTCEMSPIPHNPCDKTIICLEENEIKNITLFSQCDMEEKTTLDAAVPTLPILEDKEKKELAYDLAVVNTTKKMSKLIIDQKIKIEPEDMLQQIAPTKLLRGNAREMIRKLKYKKRVPVTELLKRLNKRTERFSHLLKQKNILNTCQSQFEHEYIQLLHDILKADYKDEWATEVYPKWKNVFQAPKKKVKNSTTGTTLKETCKTPTIPNFLYENSEIVLNDENNNAKLNIEEYITVTPRPDDNNDILTSSEILNEWRPYGVISKLLGIWRYCTETKIDAVDFCFSAIVATDKALAFSSLLSLSKDQFIEITKRPKTIYMDKIILGNTIKKLMKAEN